MSNNISYGMLFSMMKFNIHKSLIPIGISDDDYPRLAKVYDADDALMEQVISTIEKSNTMYAQRLTDKFDLVKLIEKAVTLAFLGDSITSDRQSYFNIIRKAAGNGAVTFLDYSISGQKSGDLFTIMYPDIISAHSDIAHVMIGTNDMRRMNDEMRLYHTSPEEYEKNLDYIVRALVNDGTKVILTTIPPVSQDKVSKNYPDHRMLFLEEDRILFNHILSHIAEKYGATLNNMDRFYCQHTPEELTIPDGIHLNALGQELLAYGVMQAILDVL